MRIFLACAGFAVLSSILLYFGHRYGWGRIHPPSLLLRVDYPDQPIRVQAWDPAHARADMDISMVQALYSPLLELDGQAKLKEGWATHFFWQNQHTLVLQLREDKRLANGKLLTAEDAAQSLKRLAFLHQNNHSFYVEQFCHVKTLPDMTAPCRGLSFHNQTLTIETRYHLPFLPQLLTAVETSIVPLAALTEDGLTIRSHDHGSGPYIISEIKDGGIPVLRAHPRHFNFRSDMPQTLELVPSLDATVESLERDFRERKIDHVTRFSSLNVVEFKRLAGKLQDLASIENNLPLGIGLLFFSDEARQRIPVNVRRELVLLMQKATHSCLSAAKQDELRRPTHVLIPPFGTGMFNENEMAFLENSRNQHLSAPLEKPVRVRFPQSLGQEIEPCLAHYLKDQPIVFNKAGNEKTDLRFASFDMSTYEELGALRSLLLSGFLDTEGHEPESWIKLYIAEQDRQKRMKMLKGAHLRAIWENPSIIPLWNFDTGALIRKPWTMKFSPLTVLNPFHLIVYEG